MKGIRVVMRDIFRFSYARISGGITVLFPQFEPYIKHILHHLDDAYVPFFYDFDRVDIDKYDVVIPLTIPSQRYLNLRKNSTNGRERYLIPANHCMDLCNDKELCQLFFEKKGFTEFFPAINREFNFPYVLKKKTGGYGDNIRIINDAQAEQKYMNDKASEDFFIQQHIDGQEEYTTHIIMREKVIFYRTLQFNFSQQYYVKGRNYTHSSVVEVDHGQYRKLFEEMLQSISYRGFCCFNYKLIDGNVKIFEINPRYGATMTLFINDALRIYRKNLESTH